MHNKTFQKIKHRACLDIPVVVGGQVSYVLWSKSLYDPDFGAWPMIRLSKRLYHREWIPMMRERKTSRCVYIRQ